MCITDVYQMTGRRARVALVTTKIYRHTFWATGLMAQLRNGDKLKVAQEMVTRESECAISSMTRCKLTCKRQGW